MLNTSNGQSEKVIDGKIRLYFKRVVAYKGLLLLMVPGFIFFFVFSYIPMYGVTLAFKDFRFLDGIMGSKWVGFVHFKAIFDNPYIWTVLKNTLLISILKIIFGFPAPIVFALLLNEVSNLKFKKLTQTISYLPNFIAWVIMAGIFTQLFSSHGPYNGIRELFGLAPIMLLGESKTFVAFLVVTDVYKGFGWGAIIYFASIAGINPELYESAVIDGANRYKQAVHITIPCLVPVITILLTLSVSGVLNSGFDQIINLQNTLTIQVSDVLDTYIFRRGVINQKYSFSTAVGLLKSIVAVILIASSNYFAKLQGNDYTLW
jgi:putative aldouronate transport system permease protein